MSTDELVIVGLGASAGGIAALRTFFSHVDAGGGIAYVVILHLSPEHESRLAEVLQVSSPLPVTQVTGRTRVEPDHVYVVPPNKSLTMRHGQLELSAITRIEERRAPVDIFFRTLADTHGPSAVAVVLSGSGANGSMGLKRVKERGGFILVQQPEEAEYSEMPRHSIATGLVDAVLPVAELPRRIRAYKDTLPRISIPEEPVERPAVDEVALRELWGQLRQRLGHDFTNYKRDTMLRRIERRMAVHELTELPAYVRLVREQPEEATALFRDLLISVTTFFRDREAFEALERTIVPALFEGRRATDQVRVWVAGCATGEEAYSVAMLMAEAAPADGPSVQVFASDLDDRAIAIARDGRYTLNDCAELSPERLRRFFTADAGGYRVRKELRELVLFAVHNVLKDPPFAHVDLVTCRNLLIYLNRQAQQRFLEVLHFALNPGGFLFLGSSESIEGAGDLFAPFDRDAHIFQSRAVAPRLTLPVPDVTLAGVGGPLPRQSTTSAAEERLREQLSLTDLHLGLVEQYAPPSVVVNEAHDIMHLSDRAGRYLEFAGGEPSHNLLKVVRPELRLELRAALAQAAQQRTNIETQSLAVRVGEQVDSVKIQVRPVLRPDDPLRGFFLVLFEQDGEAVAPDARPAVAGDGTQQLEVELERVKAQLRSTIERHETQAEELKASNEELHAMNEELRSSAEELETGKEELQSLNEELRTVNQELKIKVDELTQTGNDMLNLINSTALATLFLDRAGRIKLFTPRLRELFALIDADRGRTITDIRSQLRDVDLGADIERVLQHLERIEREVETDDGRWLLMHVLPYRTAEDRIDGVVITFLDISARKAAEERLRVSDNRLRLMMESAGDFAIITFDAEGRIDGWNAGARAMFGYTDEEVLGRTGDMLFVDADGAQGVPDQEMRQAREHGRSADDRWHQRKDGTRFFVSGIMSPLRDRAGELIGYVKVARDLTERQRHVEDQQRAHAELEVRVEARTEALAALNRQIDRELRERRQAEAQVRSLLTRLITVQEDERRRIGRDLHDHLGQQLTALRLKIEAIGDAANPEAARARLADAQQALVTADRDLDFLAWELRPAALDDLGLAATLGHFVREWSRNYAIPADFHARAENGHRLGFGVEVNLYRIAQEALNNIFKHAEAQHASVIFEQHGDELVLIIEDDGRGFDLEAASRVDDSDRGLGLVGMRERAALIGGRLEIETVAGEGTTVFARVPLSRSESPAQPAEGN